jgi:hypothetical protein
MIANDVQIFFPINAPSSILKFIIYKSYIKEIIYICQLLLITAFCFSPEIAF